MDCLDEGRITPSKEVHHVKKISTHPELKYDEAELSSAVQSVSLKANRSWRVRLKARGRGYPKIPRFARLTDRQRSNFGHGF